VTDPQAWGAWALICFLSGAVPYSVIIGRLLLGTDIRQAGDGNPGASNVYKASGNLPLFIVAMLLDGFKGLIPVGLANWGVGITGLPLVIVALMPVLGHAFSPFLLGRGGKAVAVSFGVLCAFTIWEGPTMLGLLLGMWFKMVASSAWAIILALLSVGAYFLLTSRPPLVLATLAGIVVILAWKHRAELRHAPGLRPSFKAWIDAWPVWRSRS
jgi:acyl phosphate:glycerol-3-phosphate acyltransferase